MAGFALALLGSVLVATPAQAYVKRTTANCPNGIQFSGSSVTVKYHFGASLGLPGDPLHMAAAMGRVHNQFNLAGGTTAEISQYSNDATTLTYQSWYNDVVPTIHVGFVPSLTGNAIGETAIGPVVNCRYTEVHVAFLDNSAWSWKYDTPQGNGEHYYDVDRYSPTGATYFDPSYLHELMHTFGLAHANASYSFLNYGVHPWTRDVADSYDLVKPLPDDVEALRDLYPDVTTRAEIGLFNSWYDPAIAPAAAAQKRLCKPSLGSGFSASRFDPKCGSGGPESGSTTVCQNDLLRLHYALTNYSTSVVNLSVGLWFSTDDTWQSTDVASVTFQSVLNVGAQSSYHHQESFTIPTLAAFASGTDLYVILKADGATTGGTSVSSWTPLRGTVEVC